MKKNRLPGFNLELYPTGINSYTFIGFGANYNSIIPQMKRSRFAPIIVKARGEDCLDQYLDCQIDCNSRYPSSNDGPDNFNADMRESCLDSCGAGYDLCSDWKFS